MSVETFVIKCQVPTFNSATYRCGDAVKYLEKKNRIAEIISEQMMGKIMSDGEILNAHILIVSQKRTSTSDAGKTIIDVLEGIAFKDRRCIASLCVVNTVALDGESDQCNIQIQHTGRDYVQA